MDSEEVAQVRSEVDALARALADERFRAVSGLERETDVASAFAAHGRAAHRDTVAELREKGERDLAARVAALAAGRGAAAEEDAWRAADAAAVGEGPDGEIGLSDAELALLHEREPERRRLLGAAVASAASSSAAPREAAAEIRARARASLGLTPPWEDVVQGDDVLGASEAAYADVLGWVSRREGSGQGPGSLDRAGLLHLIAFRDLDGLFRPVALLEAVLAAGDGVGVEVRRVRLDAASRVVKWPGAHALEARVSLRRQGGAADWLSLLDASGRAAACAATRPSTRAPALPAASGALLASLLLEPRFLEQVTGLDRKKAADVVRRLALRRIFVLRTAAAALRVAAEVERGMGGRAWREAHREALGRAALASWPDGLASRDADTDALRATLAGAAWAAQLHVDLRERFDEDFWRNPRTPEAIAGRLAAGSPGPEKERPPLAFAAEALVARLGGG